jgi:hypothetical protein
MNRITASGTIEPAVKAMRHQAVDLITLPYRKEKVAMT